MVILSSFKKSGKVMERLGMEKDGVFSVARFQPKGMRFKELEFLSATDEHGNPLRLRHLSPEEYKEAYRQKLKSRWKEVKMWLEDLREEEDIVLLCWCPHSRSSAKLLEKEGRFFCHTGLIGRLINNYRPDITVVLDEERERYLAQEWKPSRYSFLSEISSIPPEAVRGFIEELIFRRTKRKVGIDLYGNGQGFMHYGEEHLPFELHSFKRGEVVRKALLLTSYVEEIDSGEFIPF